MTSKPAVRPNRAAQYALLPDHLVARWAAFGNWDRPYFFTHIGLLVEEVRADYCRMRLPFRPEIEQAAGVVHGGAIASMLDSVVVPAVGSAYEREARYTTVDMHVQYMSAMIGEDAIGEGWVVKRGRSVVFCEAEMFGATSGKMIARSILTYNVSFPSA